MRLQLAFLLLALSPSACVFPVESWVGEENYVDTTREESRETETQLTARVSLKVGELQVEPGSADKIYEADFHYNDLAFKPDVSFERGDGGKADLYVSLAGETHSFGNGGDNSIRLRLNPEVPVELELNAGVGSSTIDLSGMHVAGVEIQSGVGETRLHMLEPNRSECRLVEITSGVGEFSLTGLGHFSFDQFRFRGGVGASELDFSGDWTKVGETEIEVGVGEVDVRLPRDIGFEIRVNQGFFSDLSVPDGFTKEGDTYYSANRDRAEKTLKIRVRAGIGEVRFSWL